jgi:HTH-type transcriptional regulator/antitoxin HigA
MIQNEREYVVTRNKLKMLAEALAELQQNPDPDLPEIVHESDLFSHRFLMEELENEIAEYEKLRDGQVSSLQLPSVLSDLPSALTRARVARGWTHRDLARALGTTEQQVQKDERGGYAKASLSRLHRVASALGLHISGEAQLAPLDDQAPAGR